MTRERVATLLQNLQSGEATIEQVLERLRSLPYEDLGYAKIDHHRELRKGVPEAIYCPGKTQAQILGLVERVRKAGSPVILTRLDGKVSGALARRYRREFRHYMPARLGLIGRPLPSLGGRVLVLSGGTADMPVAEEAAVTAELLGCEVERVYDVGVAGLHRLLDHLPALDGADVAIVVAGMEGALGSVVAGLAECPVIAVPTSVGYGANFQGMAALLSMLSSCAAGIGVVNIDNGFGAGALAAVIVRSARKSRRRAPTRTRKASAGRATARRALRRRSP